MAFHRDLANNSKTLSVENIQVIWWHSKSGVSYNCCESLLLLDNTLVSVYATISARKNVCMHLLNCTTVLFIIVVCWFMTVM